MLPVFLSELTIARFLVRCRPDCEVFHVPGYMGGAFRGGFGYTFKSIACPTHDADCVHSRLGLPCVYSQVFETPVPAGSSVMRKYDYAPHPFVLTPPLDGRSRYTKDQEIILDVVLVGRAINWLAYFICTLEELGRRGVGRARSRYRVETVESCQSAFGNSAGHARTVYDGACRRVIDSPFTVTGREMEQTGSVTRQVTIRFVTPARIVTEDQLASSLSFVTVFRSLLRRLALLSYFHCGQAADAAVLRELISMAANVKTIASRLRWRDWERYSTRQKARMKLGGLIGEVAYEGEMAPFLPYLRLGQLTHVGKATSFGLGGYVLNEGASDAA